MKIPKPEIIAPNAKKRVRWFAGLTMPFAQYPEYGEFIAYVPQPRPYKHKGTLFLDRTEVAKNSWKGSRIHQQLQNEFIEGQKRHGNLGKKYVKHGHYAGLLSHSLTPEQ